MHFLEGRRQLAPILARFRQQAGQAAAQRADAAVVARDDGEMDARRQPGLQHIDCVGGVLVRLQAEIRASNSFMPRSFWATYLNNHDTLLPYLEAETAAIHNRDADGARAACAGRAEAMGRIMVAELVRRGVFTPSVATPVAF